MPNTYRFCTTALLGQIIDKPSIDRFCLNNKARIIVSRNRFEAKSEIGYSEQDEERVAGYKWKIPLEIVHHVYDSVEL